MLVSLVALSHFQSARVLTNAGNGDPILDPAGGATYASGGYRVPGGMVLVPAGSFTMGGGPASGAGFRGGPARGGFQGGRAGGFRSGDDFRQSPPGGRSVSGGGQRRGGPPSGPGGPGGPGGGVPRGGTPAHTVTLPAYAIGKFDVTNAEYKAFVDATGQRPPRYWRGGSYPAGKANHPVAYVSLVEARAYAAWVGKATGTSVVIPTAEQWEKAARGPANTYYPWGDSFDASIQDGRLVSRCNFNALVALDALENHAGDVTAYDGRNSPYAGQRTAVRDIVAVSADGRRTPFAIDARGNVSGWIEHSTGTGFASTAYFHAIDAVGGYTTPVGSYESGKSGYGVYDAVGEIWNWTESMTVGQNGVEKGRTVNEIRGGGWYSPARSCVTVALGEGREAQGGYNTVGFRIAANLR